MKAQRPQAYAHSCMFMFMFTGLSLNVSMCEVTAYPATTNTDALLQSVERPATQDTIVYLVHHFVVQLWTMLGLNAVPIPPEQ